MSAWRRARRAWPLLGLWLGALAHAQAPALTTARPVAPVPAPPDVPAEAYYLVDAVTGEALGESAGDEPLPPASLTKLMTAYVVFQALAAGAVSVDDDVTVSEKAWRTGGSRMFIEVDTEVGVEALLHGMIVQSGNDASIALAERVAGSEGAFVERMNDQAARLGMTSTTFRNSTGLPAKGHVSSAHDLAILARALIEQFPEYYSLYSEREFTYNSITQHNRNVLLWRDASVDGLKTGHTEAAGYCLATSAERDGMRLIAVILGAKTPKARADAGLALLDYGFEFYETRRLYARGEPVTETRVWKGDPGKVELGLAEDLYVTLPRGRYQDLTATLELAADLVAPVEAAAQAGRMRVAFLGKDLRTLPLVVLRAVPEGGLWTRISDGVESWLE